MAKNELKVISIFKIIIRICSKTFEFSGKTPKFYPKNVCSFAVFFYLNKEQLIQNVCLKKYKQNENFISTLYKAKKQKKRSKNIIQLHNFHF